MKIVGYCIGDSKRKSLGFDSFSEQYRCEDLKFQQLDLSSELEDQGPFDLVIQRFIEYGKSQSEINEICKKLRKKNSSLIFLDPVELMFPMVNRKEQCRMILQCIQNHGLEMIKVIIEIVSYMKNFQTIFEHKVFCPTYCSIGKTEIPSEIMSRLSKELIHFPILCKPELATSDKAHSMCILFNESGLRDIKQPCILQKFVNHDAVIFKIYIVGTGVFICEKPSIRNLTSNEKSTIFFDSRDLGKLQSSENTDPPKGDFNVFGEIATAVREDFGLNLIGIDVIICKQTNMFAIVDINAFPSYNKMPKFFTHLERLVREKLNLRPAS